MNNTHEDAPEIFQSRWDLSYLRGPLTRDQIKILMDPLKASGSIGAIESSALKPYTCLTRTGFNEYRATSLVTS